MPKTPARPRDPNQLAKMIADIATGEVAEPIDTRDAARVERGRKGGTIGGVARAARLTPAQRSEAASLAAQARWRRKTD